MSKVQVKHPRLEVVKTVDAHTVKNWVDAGWQKLTKKEAEAMGEAQVKKEKN